MADTIVAASLSLNAEQANSSVKDFKTQLREAQKEVVTLTEKFGATSKEAMNAAKRTAELKDRIGDARKLVDSFNPDEKFKGVAQALTGVAGGFAAVTGAMGLLGIESQDVQKQLLKVQSALALSQGLNTIGDSIQSFKNLGATLVQTLGKSGLIGVAIAGVGLLTAAFLGAFDGIGKLTKAEKEAADQLRINNELNKAAADSYGKAVVEVSSMTEKIKLAKQGLLDKKEVLKEYNAGLGQVIGATNDLGKAEQNILDHGKDYIDLIFLKAKAQAAGALAIEASKKLIEDEGKAVNKSSDFFSSFFSSVEQRVKKHKKVLDEDNKNVKQYLDKQTELQKEAAKFAKDKGLIIDPVKPTTGTPKADPRIELEKQAAAEIEKLRRENFIKSIADDRARQEIQIISDFEAEKERINNLKISEKLKTDQIKELRTKRELDLAAVQKTFDDKAAADKKAADEKQAELERNALEKLTALRNENALSAIKNENDLAKARVEQTYQASIIEIEALKSSEKTKTALLIEAKIKRDDQIAELDKQLKEKRTALQLEIDTAEFGDTVLKLGQLEKWYEERLKIVEKGSKLEADLVALYEKKKTEIGTVEGNARIAMAQFVANQLEIASDLLGKQTAAGKVLAIASATINTYLAAAKALAGDYTAYGPAAPFVRIATVISTIALGLKQVREIVKVQVPGGGGGSAPSQPSISTGNISAPLQPTPQIGTTQLDQNSINAVGNAANPVQAFVLEADVRNNQERITRLNRAARLTG